MERICSLAIALALIVTAAQARPIDLSPEQLRQAETVNRDQNHRFPHQLTPTHGNCETVAFHKRLALLRLGFPADAVRPEVWWRRGENEPHMVLVLEARIHGRRTDLILDMNHDALIWL